MRMRNRRILPATWPRTVWPLSSSTRNIALGRASTTSPSSSTFSSLAMRAERVVHARRAGGLVTVVAYGRSGIRWGLDVGRLLGRRVVELGVVIATAAARG